MEFLIILIALAWYLALPGTFVAIIAKSFPCHFLSFLHICLFLDLPMFCDGIYKEPEVLRRWIFLYVNFFFALAKNSPLCAASIPVPFFVVADDTFPLI